MERPPDGAVEMNETEGCPVKGPPGGSVEMSDTEGGPVEVSETEGSVVDRTGSCCSLTISRKCFSASLMHLKSTRSFLITLDLQAPPAHYVITDRATIPVHIPLLTSTVIKYSR